jgi:hypothetical protein
MVRWTAAQKLAVILAIRDGLLDVAEAGYRHRLSTEELSSWQRSFERHGLLGLRATSLRWRSARNSLPLDAVL